jgi:hypothetical protein
MSLCPLDTEAYRCLGWICSADGAVLAGSARLLAGRAAGTYTMTAEAEDLAALRTALQNLFS